MAKSKQRNGADSGGKSKTNGDSRFDTSKDPRFKKISAGDTKLKLDDRFKEMMTDSRFAVSEEMDIYGRKMVQHSMGNVRRLYSLASDQEKKKTVKKDSKQQLAIEHEDEVDDPDNDISETDDEQTTGSNKQKKNSDGKFEWDASTTEESSSESEDDDSSDREDIENENIEYEDVSIPLGSSSRRLAVMGCDWDEYTAADILVICRSFANSAEGDFKMSSEIIQDKSKVKSVTIYPSQFGADKLEREKKFGPSVSELHLYSQPVDSDDEQDSKEKNNKNSHKRDSGPTGTKDSEDIELVRTLLKERSMYCYAVVECDSIETGERLYNELDGIETGLAIDGVDVRFIPDDIVDFKYECRDYAEDIPDVYIPPETMKNAMRHSKVKLTWDETPQRKKKVFQELFTNEKMAEMDLKEYLESEEETTDDEDWIGDENDNNSSENKNNTKLNLTREEKIKAYRKLLLDVDPQNQQDNFHNDKNNNNGNEVSPVDEDDLDAEERAAYERLESELIAPGWSDDDEKMINDSKMKNQKRKRKIVDAFPLIEDGDDDVELSNKKRKIKNEKKQKRQDSENINDEQKKNEKSKKKNKKKVRNEEDEDVDELSYADVEHALLEDDRFAELFTSPDLAWDGTVKTVQESAAAQVIAREKMKKKNSKIDRR